MLAWHHWLVYVPCLGTNIFATATILGLNLESLFFFKQFYSRLDLDRGSDLANLVNYFLQFSELPCSQSIVYQLRS